MAREHHVTGLKLEAGSELVYVTSILCDKDTAVWSVPPCPDSWERWQQCSRSLLRPKKIPLAAQNLTWKKSVWLGRADSLCCSSSHHIITTCAVLHRSSVHGDIPSRSFKATFHCSVVWIWCIHTHCRCLWFTWALWLKSATSWDVLCCNSSSTGTTWASLCFQCTVTSSGCPISRSPVVLPH